MHKRLMSIWLLVALTLRLQAQQPAKLVWTSNLDTAQFHSSGTESTFNTTRTMAIFKDRLVVLARPRFGVSSPALLLSLDLRSGSLLQRREVSAKGNPVLLATNDDHFIIGSFDLDEYTADLQPTTASYREAGHGRTILISPDGSVLGHEIAPGNSLLSASTFTERSKLPEPFAPTAVNDHGFLADNVHWISTYPKDKAFVTYLDSSGQHLLYHGDCGGRPSFLTNKEAIFTGCGKAFVIDLNGRVVLQEPLPCKRGEFAGVSRDGSRFAVACEETQGFDPSYVSKESMAIFDGHTGTKLATIQARSIPSGRSWTAFSADGRLFALGTPEEIDLYEIK